MSLWRLVAASPGCGGGHSGTDHKVGSAGCCRRRRASDCKARARRGLMEPQWRATGREAERARDADARQTARGRLGWAGLWGRPEPH